LSIWEKKTEVVVDVDVNGSGETDGEEEFEELEFKSELEEEGISDPRRALIALSAGLTTLPGKD
jgi:hypothetical protein